MRDQEPGRNSGTGEVNLMTEFHAPDGARLHFADDGEGLPILALSGLTRNGSDFDYLAPHLQDSVRLVRLDYRGRGRSEWTGPATYSVSVETGDAIALLDHLGLDRVAVIGTSRGGLIAISMGTPLANSRRQRSAPRADSGSNRGGVNPSASTRIPTTRALRSPTGALRGARATSLRSRRGHSGKAVRSDAGRTSTGPRGGVPRYRAVRSG